MAGFQSQYIFSYSWLADIRSQFEASIFRFGSLLDRVGTRYNIHHLLPRFYWITCRNGLVNRYSLKHNGAIIVNDSELSREHHLA